MEEMIERVRKESEYIIGCVQRYLAEAQDQIRRYEVEEEQIRASRTLFETFIDHELFKAAEPPTRMFFFRTVCVVEWEDLFRVDTCDSGFKIYLPSEEPADYEGGDDGWDYVTTTTSITAVFDKLKRAQHIRSLIEQLREE